MSMADMSRTLGVPEPTLRRVVRRLMDERVMTVTAVANPRLLGLAAMAWIGLRVDWTQARELAKSMLDIRGVDYVATTTGTFQVFAEIGTRDATDMLTLIGLIRALPGVRSTETFFYLDLFHQQFRWVGPGLSAADGRRGVSHGQPLSEIERELILALRSDGRRPFRRIAHELDVSESRIRRTYGKLTRSGTVRVIAAVNPARMGLRSMALMGFRVRPSASVEAIATAVAAQPRVDYLVICTGRFDLLVEVACTGPEQLATIAEERLGSIDGVEEIEVFSYLRLEYRDERVWSAGRVSALEHGSER